MDEEQPEWASIEYACVCGARFYRKAQTQKRCESCGEPLLPRVVREVVAQTIREELDRQILGAPVPTTAERALAIYHRAVVAFCEVLKAEMHEPEAMALADSNNTETGLFVCDDGSGVGFVFHSIFGTHLSPEGVKNIETQANQTIRVGLRQLLGRDADPLTAEEREEAGR